MADKLEPTKKPSKNTSDSASPQPELPHALQLLKPSWQAIQLNLITLVEFIVLPIMVSLLSALIFQRHVSGGLGYSSSSHITYTKGYFVANGVSTIASLLLAPGMVYALFRGVRGERINFLPAFRQGLRFFWRYIGVLVCCFVLVVGGFLLLIVPGLFMLRRYYLAPYYLIDRDLGVFETLRVSARESKQFTGAILGVVGAQVLFAIILIIPILGWVVGGILSVMYYSAPAIRYKQISKVFGHKPKDA